MEKITIKAMSEEIRKKIEEEADQISYHDGKVAGTFYKLGAEFGSQLGKDQVKAALRREIEKDKHLVNKEYFLNKIDTVEP